MAKKWKIETEEYSSGFFRYVVYQKVFQSFWWGWEYDSIHHDFRKAEEYIRSTAMPRIVCEHYYDAKGNDTTDYYV